MKENFHPELYIRTTRYVFGVLIIGLFFWFIPKGAGLTFIDVIMIALHFGGRIEPIAVSIYGAVFIALYFIIFGEIRWKIDVLAILLLCVCAVTMVNSIQPGDNGSDIRGNAVLKVSVFTDTREPVPNLEVDLSREQGTPPQGGIATTDASGTTIFHINPENYIIYFNLGNFPKNLEYPKEGQKVGVQNNDRNQATVILTKIK